MKLMDQVVLEVDGMTCEACVKAVERRLKGLPGVRSATVDLAAKTAEVQKDAGTTAPAEMIRAVEKLGYTAREK